MASSTSGAGIQELMAAETRASQIVAEARMGEFFLFLWLFLTDDGIQCTTCIIVYLFYFALQIYLNKTFCSSDTLDCTSQI